MRVADGPVSGAIEQLSDLPAAAIHALLGAGAFLENVVPPIPADTFIGAGGVLSARGLLDPLLAFVVVWSANVFGAVMVYRIGARWGESFFAGSVGRRLLDPGQVDRLQAFYERRGVAAIFFARFLPGFRAVVPAFAGVSGLEPIRVVPPLVIASALWYGGIFGAGWVAGENLEALEAWVRDANRVLLAAAVVGAGVVAWFWRRSRGARRAR